jgi:hypothetical protein
MPSKQHEEAMAYIYGKESEFNEEEETQCQRCKRGVNLYNEPIFVIGIYVDDVRTAQERWCTQCALKGMKGE